MELKEGNFYYFKGRKNEPNQEFIVTKNKHICINTKYFCKIQVDWNIESNIPLNVRIATEKEKQWLNACIKANKFIPLSEIKEENLLNSFQLF